MFYTTTTPSLTSLDPAFHDDGVYLCPSLVALPNQDLVSRPRTLNCGVCKTVIRVLDCYSSLRLLFELCSCNLKMHLRVHP